MARVQSQGCVVAVGCLLRPPCCLQNTPEHVVSVGVPGHEALRLVGAEEGVSEGALCAKPKGQLQPCLRWGWEVGGGGWEERCGGR